MNQILTATEIAGFAGAGLAGAAYVPQISHLVRARCSAGISRLAFAVWLLASLLITARAIAIHAGVFIVLGGIQIVATALHVMMLDFSPWRKFGASRRKSKRPRTALSGCRCRAEGTRFKSVATVRPARGPRFGRVPKLIENEALLAQTSWQPISSKPSRRLASTQMSSIWRI